MSDLPSMEFSARLALAANKRQPKMAIPPQDTSPGAVPEQEICETTESPEATEDESPVTSSFIIQKRTGMVMIIRGMIQLKFPEIDRLRCVRISKALEFRLWMKAKEEQDDENDGGEEAVLDAYSDMETLQQRLRTLVSDLQEARK